MPGRSGIIFLKVLTRSFRRNEEYYCKQDRAGFFTQITEAEPIGVFRTTKGEQSVSLRRDNADNTGAAAT